jgi:RNA polymerase sigma-70 factor, ECF subfamily
MVPPSARRPGPHDRTFRLLYEAHFAYVVHMAGLFGVPARYREDVAQEVFATLYREIGKLDLTKPLRPWLVRTTFSRAVDWLRRAGHREQPTGEADEERADTAPNPEEGALRERMRRHLEDVLLEIPQEQRTVLVLAEVEDMSAAEIAEALDIPVGTVKTRLRAAKGRGREVWERRVATGAQAVLPFALWSVGDLLHAQQAIPPAPPGVEAAVWGRLVPQLGLGVAGAAAGAGAGAAAAKVGVAVSAKHVVAAAVLAAGVGGAYLAGRESAPSIPARVASVRPEDHAARVPAASSAPSASALPSAPQAVTVAPAVSATPSARALPPTDAAASSDENDRAAIHAAQAALLRGDVSAARAALARVRGSRFAEERAALQRSIDAYRNGGR